MSRHYLLFSVIIIIVMYIPLMLRYEKHVRTRELVLIAVMCSITVLANCFTVYTIPIHAGTALVIITGVALGPEAGLACGCLARFIANFFMGQGIWTPYEMIAWGFLGFFAGCVFSDVKLIGYLDDARQIKREDRILGLRAMLKPLFMVLLSELTVYLICKIKGFNYLGFPLYLAGILGIVLAIIVSKGKIRANSITVSVYTWLSVLVIYGGIMNGVHVISFGELSLNSANSWLLAYTTGLSYDLMHASTAAVCTYFFGESIIRKLRRVQIKYGIRS